MATSRGNAPPRSDERKPARLSKALDPTGALQRSLDQSHADRTTAAQDARAKGVLVTGVAFAVNQVVKIPHKLGRTAKYWQVIREYGAAPSFLVEVAPTDDKFLTLQHLSGTGACVVDLWVWS